MEANICFFCSSQIQVDATQQSNSTSKNASGQLETAETLFLLHKMLQIPLWTSCKYLSTGKEMIMCFSCTALISEGRDLVDKVEQLQLKLQTLQATLQNLVLSTTTKDDINDKTLKCNIRDEIHNNLTVSALPSTHFVSNGAGGLQEIGEVESNYTFYGPLNQDTAVEKVIMEFEAGDVKMEQTDHLSFDYEEVEVLDFVQPTTQQPPPLTYGQKNYQIQEIAHNQDRDDDVQIIEANSGPSKSRSLSGSQLVQGKRKRAGSNGIVNDSAAWMASVPSTSAAATASTSSGAIPSLQSSSPILSKMLTSPQGHRRISTNSQPETIPGVAQVIWSGILEWHNKLGALKETPLIPCKITSPITSEGSLVNSKGWPEKIMLRLIPKQLINSLPSGLFNNATFVEVQPEASENTMNLIAIMTAGFAGCVHFLNAAPDCKVKLLILLYSVQRKAFLGFIAANQNELIDEIRALIRKQEILKQQCPQLYQQTAALTAQRARVSLVQHQTRYKNLQKIQQLKKMLEEAQTAETALQQQLNICPNNDSVNLNGNNSSGNTSQNESSQQNSGYSLHWDPA